MTDPTEQEVALITVALNHAWERFNFRVTNALQILNYYILSMAILAAAYVGALTQACRELRHRSVWGIGSVLCRVLRGGTLRFSMPDAPWPLFASWKIG